MRAAEVSEPLVACVASIMHSNQLTRYDTLVYEYPEHKNGTTDEKGEGEMQYSSQCTNVKLRQTILRQ